MELTKALDNVTRSSKALCYWYKDYAKENLLENNYFLSFI